MDAVEKAGNGHPGTAMSLAPAAYLLFNRVMRHDPTDPNWPGRDRFVLSCGHSSLTLYIQLYLSGYGLSLDDLQVAAAVGLADPGPPRARAHRRRGDHHRPARARASATRSAWRWRPAASAACSTRTPRPARASSTTTSTCIASDGDIEEGISHEVSSLAGHQQLGNLVADLRRQRDLDRGRHPHRQERGRRRPLRGVRLARADRRLAHRRRRRGRLPRGRRGAVRRARRPPRRRPTGRRSSRCARSSAGRRPNKQNTGKIHGSALGADEVAATKKILGFDPAQTLRGRRRGARARPRGGRARPDGARRVAARPSTPGRGANPDAQGAARPAGHPHAARRLDRRAAGVPGRRQGHRHPRPRPARCSTRSPPVLPELWGGSADLAESNNTTMEGEPSFIPAEHATKAFPGDEYGRTLHFGIREHAHGRDPQRHRAARRHPPVRRHVPGLQRLHAPGGAAGRADEAAGRSTSGRTTRSASARTARPTSRSST